MRRICLLAILAFVAVGLKAEPAATDSLDRAVATFFASQFKMAFANGIGDLRATGLDVDSAKVLSLVAGQLTRPYDSAEQDRAFAVIDAAAKEAVAVESERMLAEAAAAPGAVVLPSGVVVQTVKEGSGPLLTRADKVTMRYIGRLPDGTVFDSMSEEDEPIVSPVTQFVPGMTEGLTYMRPGGEYIITIPAAQAYGGHGIQGVIPPDCAIQFTVTL